MAIKISTGKLEIDLPRFVKTAEASGFEWLDIKNEQSCPLPPCRFSTSDAKLARYGSTVRVVWRNETQQQAIALSLPFMELNS